MMRALSARIGRLEAVKKELSPQLRLWLGEPITDEERAAIILEPHLSNEEQAAALAALPTDMREWFGNRLYPESIT